MDYKRIYFQIIRNRLDNPLCSSIYGEEHHIIPRSLGGSNDKNNLVRLTAREHYICHFLLYKIFKQRYSIFKTGREKERYIKMMYALSFMNNVPKDSTKDKRMSSSLYAIIREQIQSNVRHYSKSDIKCFLQFYLDNNLTKSSYYKLQQHFGIDLSYSVFHNNLTRHGWCLHGFFPATNSKRSQNIEYEKVAEMFEFFIANKYLLQKDWSVFQKKFNYSAKQKSVYELFRRNGFKISKLESDAILGDMFTFYKDNIDRIKKDFNLFKEKFEYPYTERSLRALFIRHGYTF